MLLATLDEITKRGLLEDCLPIHFYSEMMFHSATCLRELNFDTLQMINTANLPVNSYGAVDLPGDFSDDLAVCVPFGSGLAPLPHQDWITPLRIHDTTTGEFVPYDNNDTSEDENTVWGLPQGFGYYWNVDSYGQSTGRNFGGHGGTASGYRVIKERRQIQMTDDFISQSETNNIILMYISNGQSIDNATQIDYAAFNCIRAYQSWKSSPNKNNENSPEGRYYLNQKRLLRARYNQLTITDIRNILHTAYTATLKT